MELSMIHYFKWPKKNIFQTLSQEEKEQVLEDVDLHWGGRYKKARSRLKQVYLGEAGSSVGNNYTSCPLQLAQGKQERVI